MKDRDSSQSLYHQIAQQLIEHINRGVYKPGERLPSENELASQYGVHRLTARHAIATLIEKNLVYRMQGRGTFVNEQKLDYSINFGTNFTESLFNLGYLPYRKILSIKVISIPPAIAAILKTPVSIFVYQIKVLRQASRQITDINIPETYPLCISISYLLYEKFPELSVLIYKSSSLYSLLQNYYGIQPYRTWTKIETELASREDTKLLQIKSGIPMLITKSLVCDQNKKLFEYTISRFRGDIFSLEVTF